MYYQESNALAEYLDALFGYYESEGKGGVDKTVSVAPPTVKYRSNFEAILAKFGLDLGDASFDEIIKGDYYAVLKRHGLVDNSASNNVSYQSLGGVI